MYFLENEENYPEIVDWIEDQPGLDQPDILREMVAICKDHHLITGEQDWLDKANYIDSGIDDVEQDILNEKLYKALFMMQFDNVEFETEKVILFLNEARKVIIEIMQSNPENNKEMWRLAQLAIKLEKETCIFDPYKWMEVFKRGENPSF